MEESENQYHQLKQGNILNKKYRIEKTLGEGGFGITYLAVDTLLELPVAIKEYYPAGYVTRETAAGNTVMPFSGEKRELYEEGKQKFIKEARAMGKLAGQRGIVAVRDYFEENNTAYIVMEYLNGITLKTYLKQNEGVLSPQETLQLIKPVVKSLALVHAQGLIHRDISPDNIMVLAENQVKLLDFGASRSVSINGEKSLSVLLKPGYAPEEQYRTRGEQGPWSDIYALCATCYRCITGHVPIEAMERMREDGLKPPSALGIPMDKDVERALMRGLAVFKENRIQDARELYTAWYGVWEEDTESGESGTDGKKEDSHTGKKRKGKKKLFLAGGIALAVFLAATACGLLFLRKPEVAETPGIMQYSSCLLAAGDNKFFVKQQTGLFWCIQDKENGILQIQKLFHDIKLGNVLMADNGYVYMVLSGGGIVRFAADGSGGIEDITQDAAEDFFLMTQEEIFYMKKSDGNLYRVPLNGGESELVSADTFSADSFTLYGDELWYYTENGKKGSGIYVYNLLSKKLSKVSGSETLGEILYLRSGSKILYAVTKEGVLYTIDPASHKITETDCCDIASWAGICPVENTQQKGFFYLKADGKTICFYDRVACRAENSFAAMQTISRFDYVDNRLFFMLMDGSYHYLNAKGVIEEFEKTINWYK